MANEPATIEGQAVMLPPHLWENFEKADAELREFYGVSPGALALMRLWLACGASWRVRAEFERSVLDIKHRGLHPNKEGDFVKTAFENHFGRISPRQGQMPLATSRLELKMAGKNKEALCH